MSSLSPRVVENLAFLIELADSSYKKASTLLRKASENELYALRDATKDLLDFKVNLTHLQREALAPFVDALRSLGYATNEQSIKEALRIHFAFRPLLLQGILIPVVEQVENTFANPHTLSSDENEF